MRSTVFVQHPKGKRVVAMLGLPVVNQMVAEATLINIKTRRAAGNLDKWVNKWLA